MLACHAKSRGFKSRLPRLKKKNTNMRIKINYTEEHIVHSEYLPVVWFFFIALFLAILLFWLSYKFSPKNPYPEKLSPYECGFNPYDDARNRFDVRFYLISILFIVFDIEAALIFPWAVHLGHLDSFGFWTMIDFVIELVIGYIYAWRVGALDWD